jgi:mannose-6-phosphate isomerase-like protein (cupin superfamily)
MLITSANAPRFEQDGTTAVGYASPSRGTHDLSLWRVAVAAGHSSPPHSLSHEEVFLAVAGSATATLGERRVEFTAGDCLVVPPGVAFTLTAGDQGVEAVCAMAAAGQATILPDGPTLTPPWAV